MVSDEGICRHLALFGMAGNSTAVNKWTCVDCGATVARKTYQAAVFGTGWALNESQGGTMSQYASKADMIEAELSAYKAMCERLAKALDIAYEWAPSERVFDETAMIRDALADYRKLKGE